MCYRSKFILDEADSSFRIKCHDINNVITKKYMRINYYAAEEFLTLYL